MGLLAHRDSTFAIRPELVAVGIVYLVQGLLGLSRLAVFIYLKDDLKLDPAAVAFYSSLTYIPWMIKPLYGFLSDTVPLFGYRRRTYLVACGLLNMACWLLLAWLPAGLASIVGLQVLSSAATACSDVVADSIVVELCRGEPQARAGSLQSMCWGCSAIGSVASAYFSGSLVGTKGTRIVFALTAIFPSFTAVAAAAIPETRADVCTRKLASPAPEIKRSANMLRGLVIALQHPAIYLPTVFVFSWQAAPSIENVMTYFQTDALGFTTEMLGRIRLVGALASLAGVGLYNYALRATPLRRIFLWTGILGAALGLTQLILITGLNLRLGIGNEVFALLDTTLLTVLGQLSFMPVLVLASRICPEGVEATLFATLMSVLNAGSFVGQALGSGMTRLAGVSTNDFSHLPDLVVVVTLCGLAPLFLLRFIPRGSSSTSDALPVVMNAKKG